MKSDNSVEILGECKLRKVAQKSDPRLKEMKVIPGDWAKGKAHLNELKIGRSFIVYGENTYYHAEGGYFHTSVVESIYEHNTTSGFDKLMLPKEFGVIDKIELPELKDKDILFATNNSIYHLRRE